MLNNFSISKRNKIKGKEQTSFCKIVQNKSYCTKVLLVMFNVNYYTLWFHPRTQYFDLACTASYTKAHESTALHVSNEWLHLHRRKSVQPNEQYHRKVLLSSFYLNGDTSGFHPQTQKLNYIVQPNKQYHRKLPLSSFHMNGDASGYHPQNLHSEVR